MRRTVEDVQTELDAVEQRIVEARREGALRVARGLSAQTEGVRLLEIERDALRDALPVVEAEQAEWAERAEVVRERAEELVEDSRQRVESYDDLYAAVIEARDAYADALQEFMATAPMTRGNRACVRAAREVFGVDVGEAWVIPADDDEVRRVEARRLPEVPKVFGTQAGLQRVLNQWRRAGDPEEREDKVSQIEFYLGV